MGGGMGGRGGSGGGGGYRRGFGGRPHDGTTGDNDNQAMRPLRLPRLIHVTQTARIVSVEDSSGAVIEEIATVPAAADTFDRAPGAVHVLGAWNGRALEMSRETPDGAKRTETWSLIDDGASLVSEVKITGGGIPERSFKRVFKRVNEP